MSSRRLIALAALVAVIGGCRPSSAVRAGRAARAARPDPPEVLRIRIPEDPGDLPCELRSDAWCDRMLVDTVYEPLVRWEPGRGFVGVLASDWRYLDAGATFQLDLRKDVRWHDGRPFKARDVKETLARVMAGTAGQGYASVQRQLQAAVSQIQYPTDHLLELRFHRPFGPILELLAMVPILPAPPELKPGSAPGVQPRPGVIGTGPFEYVQWWPQEKIVLARSAGYRGPRARLARIEFHRVPTLAEAITRLKEGKLDLVFDLRADDYRQVLQALGSRAQTLAPEPAEFAGLSLNATRPPFDDARVRRAFALLLDRRKLSSALPGPRSQLLEQPIWMAGPQAASARGTGVARDVAAARALLEEAGWKVEPGQTVRRKAGRDLTVQLVTSDTFVAFNRGLRALRDDLAESGVNLNVDLQIWGQFVLALRRRAFDAIALGRALGGAWTDLTDLFHSTSVTGGANWGGFRSPEVDALLARIQLEIHPRKRSELERQVFVLLGKETPLVPLYAPRMLGVSRLPLSAPASAAWLDLARTAPVGARR